MIFFYMKDTFIFQAFFFFVEKTQKCFLFFSERNLENFIQHYFWAVDVFTRIVKIKSF